MAHDLPKQIEAIVVSVLTAAAKLQANTVAPAASPLLEKLDSLRLLFDRAWASTTTAEATVKRLSRQSLMRPWIKFLNSCATNARVERLQMEVLQPADLCLRALVMLPDTAQELFISLGGFQFLTFQLEYLNAHLQASRALKHTKVEGRDLQGWTSNKLSQLLDATTRLVQPSWLRKPWAKRVFAQDIGIARLVNAACSAASLADPNAAAGGSILIAPMLVDTLLGTLSSNPDIAMHHPAVAVQAQRFLSAAQPDSLLMRTLRQWWLEMPTVTSKVAPGMEAAQFIEKRAATCASIARIVGFGGLTGGRAFEAAWFSTIIDKLDAAYGPMMRICTPEDGNPLQGAVCSSTFYQLTSLEGFPAALTTYWDPNLPRCPESLKALADLMVQTVALPCDHADGSYAACAASCIMSLQNLAKGLASTEAGVGVAMRYHQPTVRLLMESGGSRLLEAFLRTTSRLHDNWHCTSKCPALGMKYSAGELAASLCMVPEPATNLQATMSVLATLRKILHVKAHSSETDAAEQDQTVADCAGICIEALVSAWSEPMEGSTAELGKGMFRILQPSHPASRHSLSAPVPAREALSAYTAAWVLPALLARAPQEAKLEELMASLARLVAFLHPTAAINDAVAQHIFGHIAMVFDACFRQALPSKSMTEAALCMVCMAINLISAQPGGDRRLRCAALVQAGLLGCISRLACRWWADEAWHIAYGLLIKRLLPAIFAITPTDAATSSRLRAADACFAQTDVNLDCIETLSLKPTLSQAAKMEALRTLSHLCQRWSCNLEGACEADLCLRKCSGCMRARYCSAACQKAAWKVHKRVCAELRAVMCS
ncbi:hypothetical protein WJX72_006382 [[Myrmecia] bisecta]|uniref:MYND-type domain-containing protein n=1 Tax=[Myrmecia] bisecta TaxID=41462 RepID=A0AAW1P841_9CHLO